jgi:hypothetical protein
MRVVDVADDTPVEGGTVLARQRGSTAQDSYARSAMLAQSLAAAAVAESIEELRRIATSGLEDSVRLKAAVELIRIASTPPKLEANNGAAASSFGGQQQQAPQVVILDLKEAGRMARDAK